MSTSKMSRRCPVDYCGAMIPRTKIMCKRDWVRVPNNLRQELSAAARGTDAGFKSAVKAVIEAASNARNPKKPEPAPQEDTDAIIISSTSDADAAAVTAALLSR